MGRREGARSLGLGWRGWPGVWASLRQVTGSPGLLKGQAAYGKRRLEGRAMRGSKAPPQTSISWARVGMLVTGWGGAPSLLWPRFSKQGLRMVGGHQSSLGGLLTCIFPRHAGLEIQGAERQRRGGGNLDFKHDPHVIFMFPFKFKDHWFSG